MGKNKLILTALLFAALFSVTASAREIHNFNGGWRFFYGNDPSGDGGVRVSLPHTWSRDAIAGDKDYFRGMGYYMNEAQIPESWRGGRVFIRFHAANNVSNLYLNGRHVGEHKGGYSAFAYEITDYVQFGGKNVFWMAVNNSPRSDVLPVAGDQNSYGGLVRDVELIVTGRDMVSLTDHGSEGVYVIQKSVTDQMVEAEAEVLVCGVRDNNVTAVVTVADDDGAVVAMESARVRLSGRATSSVRIPFSFTRPRLWRGVEDPYLYTVSVTIQADESRSDSVAVRTGFRRVEVSPDGPLLLNGKPYTVRGVSAVPDQALTGPVLNRRQVAEDFEFLTEMGVTAVRIPVVMHHPYFYELCDRYGLLVWQDFPLTGSVYFADNAFPGTESFRTNGMNQATGIIKQLYNHPSVVMWGIFSDMHMRGDNPVDYISNLNLMAKREDPSRLTTALSNEDGEINFVTDLVMWDHHFGWRAGVPSDIQIWKRQFQLNWNNVHSAVNWGAGASVYHQGDTLRRPNFIGRYHPERWQTHLHEQYYRYLNGDGMFWGLFAGQMFDYGAAGRTWGEGNGVNDMGLVTFDRRTRKDAYYFFKANWNPYDPFVYIAEKRWTDRHSTRQDIRAFTNRPEAELYVNGVPVGVARAELGTVSWKDIELHPGENTIEVRSNELYDRAVVTVSEPGPSFRIR
ncbi:MAG: glycoside hydrolase family 2 protein [Alistipes sp.]|nr:glycoside hydrolase family 2 protein [Alistipes sp.]